MKRFALWFLVLTAVSASSQTWELIPPSGSVHPASVSISQPTGIIAKEVFSNSNPCLGPAWNIFVNQSTDGGASWSTLFRDFSYESSPRGPRTLVVHPDSPLRFYLAFEATMDMHVVRSTTDGGQTWVFTNVDNGCMQQALAVDRDPQKAYLINESGTSSQGYFWRTSDGGQNWEAVAELDPSLETMPWSVTSYPANSGTVFMGTMDRGVYRSTDGGDSWEPLGLNGNRVASLAIANGNPSTVYAGVLSGPIPGVHKSTNGGISWSAMNTGLTYPATLSLFSDPAEPELVYAATYSGSTDQLIGHCYVSVDGAKQWTEITGNLPSEVIWDLQMDYNQPDKLYTLTVNAESSPEYIVWPVSGTGLYAYALPWQQKPLTTASSEASDFNSQRKLVRQDGTSILHAVYHSGGSGGHHVYYSTTLDYNGSNWSPKALLGTGKCPALELDEAGNPQVIWLSDDETQLLYAYRQNGTWVGPTMVYTVADPVHDRLGPPAFRAAPGGAGWKGHIVFHWQSTANPPRNAIRYGWLQLNQTGQALQGMATIDSHNSSDCLRPSLALYQGDFQGFLGYSLHAAWTKGNHVYYSSKILDETNPQPWSFVFKVTSTNGNESPNIEAFQGKVQVVWVQTAAPRQIRSRSRTLSTGTWNAAKKVVEASGCSSPQIVAGTECFWCQNDGGNWEVYKSSYAGTTWQTPQRISNTLGRSVSPQVAFAWWPDLTLLFALWTEGDASPYEEFYWKKPGLAASGVQSKVLSENSISTTFSLGGSYPNPLTSRAFIEYTLPKMVPVELTVFNISGQVIRRLKNEPNQAPGRYTTSWDGRSDLGHRVPAGVYFYRLNAGDYSETKRVIVVR